MRARHSRRPSGHDLSGPPVVLSILLVLVVGATAPAPSIASAAPATLQTQILDVVPASTPNETGIQPIERGERMLVRGVTSLRSDQNIIVVTFTRPGRTFPYDTATAAPWGTDGIWTVTLSTPPDLDPGTYVVVADDGYGPQRVTVDVVERRSQPTATTTTPTPTATLTATASPTATPTPVPPPTTGPTLFAPEPITYGVVLLAFALLLLVVVARLRR